MKTKKKTIKFRLTELQGKSFTLQLKRWWGWVDHYWYANGPGYAGRGIEIYDTEEEAIDEIYKIEWSRRDEDLILVQYPSIKIK